MTDKEASIQWMLPGFVAVRDVGSLAVPLK
jgi:hypothetical protein